MPAPACRTHIAQANRVARNPGHAKMADVFYETSARLPSTLSSGGGGIRTRDLWVMSPTSCRCSTPRHECILDSRRGGARSGLASHGVAPAVLSGAALGHDRVRDGSGWSQNALGHGHRPASRVRCAHASRRSQVAARVRTGRVRRDRRNPPSAMSTSRLRSVTRRPPLASLPGRLPGAFLLSNGEPRLGAGFPLRCFQRFAHPDVATQRCRLPDNWLTSGPSSPVLSY